MKPRVVDVVVMRRADMFEHADRDDPVEALGQLAVVAQLEMNLVFKFLLPRPLGRYCMLFRRQRDAEHIGVEAACEVKSKPAPA